MQIIEFVNSIYLGDRSCKCIIVDVWNEVVKFQVDVISRMPLNSSEWNFYTDGDIENGYIVFENVKSFSYNLSKILPNGYINMFEAERLSDEKYLFKISLGCYSENADYEELEIEIVACKLYLESPDKPNEKIII